MKEEQIKLKQELLNYIRETKTKLKRRIDALDIEEKEITDEMNDLQKAIRL